MKAVEITEFGGPEVLKLTQRPTPSPARGEVLIRVAAAGVNRPDVFQRRGLYPPPPGASDIPGLEVAGEIAEVGAHVNGLAVGDRVCALVTGGGYAEYCLAPHETVLPVPSSMSLGAAAAVPETFFTVWSNVFERAYIDKDEWLLVHGGSSGIGSTAIQLAKAFSIHVATTAGSAEKCAFCKELGADVAIDYTRQDYVERVKQATDGRGVDVVLDMVGGDYLARNIACLAPGGRHVSIAFLTGPKAEIDFLPVMLKRLVLTGSTLRAQPTAFKGAIAESLRRLVWPLLEAEQIAPVIDSTFPLAEAHAAHGRMESSAHMGKIVLDTEGG